MIKILMISEEPNGMASELTHDELFDLSKNTFSQFFGRALFGSEEAFRKSFNPGNICWMHAKGSKCHGSEDLDGRAAIYQAIQDQRFDLIVAFGRHAMKLFVDRKKAVLSNLDMHLETGPVSFQDLLTAGIAKKVVNEFDPDQRVAFLLHPSGQANSHWMDKAEWWSDSLHSVQVGVRDILGDQWEG